MHYICAVVLVLWRCVCERVNNIGLQKCSGPTDDQKIGVLEWCLRAINRGLFFIVFYCFYFSFYIYAHSAVRMHPKIVDLCSFRKFCVLVVGPPTIFFLPYSSEKIRLYTYGILIYNCFAECTHRLQLDCFQCY
jgi:hypothetical protein